MTQRLKIAWIKFSMSLFLIWDPCKESGRDPWMDPLCIVLWAAKITSYNCSGRMSFGGPCRQEEYEGHPGQDEFWNPSLVGEGPYSHHEPCS